MNFKIIVSLFLICTFSLCCSPKQDLPDKIKVTFGENVDPNTMAVVYLVLEGDTLPGTVKVVSAENTSAAIFEKIGASEDVRQFREDRWVAILHRGESYVIGWIVEDDALFGYCSEPFIAENDIEVTFSPGMPITFEYDVTEPEEGVKVFPVGFVISRKTENNGSTSLMSWRDIEILEEPSVIKIGGLAQGTYQISAQALVREGDIQSRSRVLVDKRFIEVEPGKVNRIKAVYPELDTTVEQGDVTIKGVAYNTAGEVLPNETIQLIPYSNSKPMLDLYYPDSITDSNGIFEFVGVRPEISLIVKCGNSGISISDSSMTRASTFWLDFIIGTANVPLTIGDVIPEFIVDWKDGQSGKMLDLYGKTVVIDVWASWCAPCLEALPKLNDMAQEFKDNDDIVFVALSIDSDRDNWQERINQSDWDALRHGWYNRQKNPLALNRPIPYTMILDNKGILRQAGNGLDIRAELKKVMEASE